MDIKRRIQDIVNAEAAAISAIHVTDEFERAVHALNECRGKIIVSGMGKAGMVARKFAATLSSTCTPAAFIHPGDAAHGDLGLVADKDCFVAFSTSGKTREVIEMLKLAKHLGVSTIIGVTSHPDSELRGLSDIILDMGIISEPCPLGLTPSASIAVMLTISDSLALTLMEIKDVSRHDYGLRHHGGYLGRKARTDNE